MIGRTLGHHRIIEKIGSGGMGEVYLAHDDRLDRDVALKTLRAGAPADAADRKRFRKEAHALSRLNHPNIATVHDFDTQEGVDFLVMEYISGTTLSEKLAHGPIPEKELLRLGAQLAEGLAAAHDQGVIHRDLKPGNLRVTADGRLKILDFGIANLLARDAGAGIATTRTLPTQSVIGTLAYMAPEQLTGEQVDRRSDLWSTGVVLYEMATGARPFEGSLATLPLEIQTRTPTPPTRIHPHVSPGLERVILKCLEKDPDLRYQSARDLLADFRRLAATEAAALTPRVAAKRVRFAPWIAAAVLVLAVGAAAGLVLESRRRAAAARAAPPQPIASLAVLPLANLSNDVQQEFLVEGMQEALITELSKISALRVISRTSTVRYKGTDRLLAQIAKELNVDAVVEGSVLRAGNRLRVSAQLIQVAPERHLWADNFDREITDILYLTSDVAQAVASRIRVIVTPAEKASLARARQVNPQAYELYVLGRHYWGLRTIDDQKRAVESFRKALAIDPEYPAVYAALADSYLLLGEQGGIRQPDARSEAAVAVRRALQLDPNLAEAYTSRGQLEFAYNWNWTEAEKAFKRAIELNAGYAWSHQLYGRSLGFVGRFDDALRELARAKELDPLSITLNAYTGQVYFFARQYDRAAAHLEWTLQLNPNHALVRHNLGELYLGQHRFGEAVAQLEKSMELSRDRGAHYLAMLGCAYAGAGRRRDALRVLDELTDRSKDGLASAFDMASLHMALGDREQALTWLERGYEQRDCWLIELTSWPWFDSLASDPRFQSLKSRLVPK